MLLLLLKVLFGLLLVAAICMPAYFISVSAVRYRRATDGISSWAILVGGILLALLSLDILYRPALTLLFGFDAEQMVVLAYIEAPAAYFGLLLLGIGLWIQSKRIQSILVSKADNPVEPHNQMSGD